jgi:hypothetical protein
MGSPDLSDGHSILNSPPQTPRNPIRKLRHHLLQRVHIGIGQ